jgi:carbamoyl-phosphate synthase small subunit
MESTEQDQQQVAVLALEDGAVFYGRPFGAALAPDGVRRGEVVFATSMTGYQEICTDPSYRGQMVVLTYPLVGNYGVAPEDVESRRPWLSALLVREACEEFSHWRAAESLDAYLRRSGIPGMCELDTRALTRHLRTHGTKRGIIRVFPAGAELALSALIAEAGAVHSVSELDVVREVALPQAQPWHGRHAASRSHTATRERPRVVLIDMGFKQNIARCLEARGLEVYLAPPSTDPRRLSALCPDGVLLSNGPGDPETQTAAVGLVRDVLRQRLPLPVMGICLGHQVIGLAAGATTSRLPFGHHGANHPVLECETGRVTVTSQNHNFQVDAASLPAEGGFRVSHVNLSDGSVEGLAHESLPIFSVQYHPEACPGPEDNRYLFDRFADMVRARWRAGHETELTQVAV